MSVEKPAANLAVRPLGKRVVTIDGPAGSGKSTVARALAQRLGFLHLNSGALFRAVALRASQHGVLSQQEEPKLNLLVRSMNFRFVFDAAGLKLLVDGQETGAELFTREVGELASQVGVFPEVRQRLLEVQRQTADEYDTVVEGRDAGTVIFPDTPYKFYLFASVETRARRRLLECGLDEESDADALFNITQELELRDRRDANREAAPHTCPVDAYIIDTEGLSVDEVIEEIQSRLPFEGIAFSQ